MACTLLASKVEECPRRVRDIVNTFHYLYAYFRRMKYRPFRYTQDEYYEWRDRATDAEMRILRACSFRVTPFHPTGLLVSYLNALRLLDSRDLCQCALNYLFDSTRSVLSIRHMPNTVACACIRLAVDTESPRSAELPDGWNIVFDVSHADLDDAIAILRSVYSQPLDLDLPISWHEQGTYAAAFHEFMRDKSLIEQEKRQPRAPSPALSYSSFSSGTE
jgi:hypothetical protein